MNGEETGAVQQLRSATDNLANITAVFPKANELNTRLDSVYIEIKDIAEEVSRAAADIDFRSPTD